MIKKKLIQKNISYSFSRTLILITLYTSLFISAPLLSLAETASTTAEATSSAPTLADIQKEQQRQVVDSLKNKIDSKNNDITALEQEIKGYRSEIQKAGSQSQTLQGALRTLELTRKKLTAESTVTGKKIEATTLSIQSLTGAIGNKQRSINSQQESLRQTIIKTHEGDQTSLVEMLLRTKVISMSAFWNTQYQLGELQGSIRTHVQALAVAKTDLTAAKTSTEKKQRELLSLQNQLADQKKIVESNKSQTSQLLSETKNKESNYKKLVADKAAKRIALQQELNDYESQLKLIIDPTSYPAANSKVLSPPLGGGLVITQEFGDTVFSRTTSAYNGRGHNGVDFKASPGTPIYAALAGIVLGTGNTDIVCHGASYGRWVFIKHGNGLSTVYAHLSLIKAVEGSQVETGDLLGYSGSSGYVTGPHLHFGLFASQGVRIMNLKSRVCAGTYRVPVADFKAYLNPLLYL